jgi:type VI secretion system protein ImpM
MWEQAGSGRRRVGFLGKLPSQADFVRQPIADPIGKELDQWLVKSVQNLHLVKAELPETRIRFVLSAQGCDSIAIGVLGKSRDQLGRSFPLAIYTSAPGEAAAQAFHALPLAYGAFLARAESVLLGLAEASVDTLRAQVAELEQVPVALLTQAEQRCAEVLAATASSELFARVFAGRPADAYLYGLYTLRTAASAAQRAPGGAAPTVLGCPIANDVDLLAWLDLTRRCLGWTKHVPSYAWIEEPEPRLLLSLGYASDQLLRFVADPQQASARLWPLWTDRAEAIVLARDALALPATLPASLDTLWTLVARGSG